MRHLIARAARRGLAYGLAVACVDLGLAANMMISLRLPAMTTSTVIAAGVEIALGLVLGLLATPLLTARGGGVLHALAMAGVSLALRRHLAMDPADLMGWLAAPVAGLLLLAGGGWLARRRPLLPWAIGAALLAAVVVVPVLVSAARSADEAALPAATAPAGAPDVVLVVLDTVRAANMSAYGYGRQTTPHFDALAARCCPGWWASSCWLRARLPARSRSTSRVRPSREPRRSRLHHPAHPTWC